MYLEIIQGRGLLFLTVHLTKINNITFEEMMMIIVVRQKRPNYQKFYDVFTSKVNIFNIC